MRNLLAAFAAWGLFICGDVAAQEPSRLSALDAEVGALGAQVEKLFNSSTPPPDLSFSRDSFPLLSGASGIHRPVVLDALQYLEELGERYQVQKEAISRAAPGASSHAEQLAWASLRTEAKRRFEDSLGGFIAPPHLVVAGGVSMGSYQAGFLEYYVRHLRTSAEMLQALAPSAPHLLKAVPPEGFRRDSRIVTGASAGSINAFLAGLQGCRPLASRLEDSLFFQAWVDVGFAELFDPKQVTSDSGFTRKAIDARIETVEKYLDEPVAHDCHFVFGATATRLQPRQVFITPELKLERLTEKFVVQLTGTRGGKLISKGLGDGDFLLSPAEDSSSLMDVLRASSAFPVAFSPMGLSYLGAPGRATDLGDFIDGGALNNNPLDLVLHLENVKAQKSRWPERAATYLFLDQDATDADSYEPGPSVTGNTLFARYVPFLQAFVGTAGTQQLMQALEDAPKPVRERVVTPRRRFASPSEYFVAMTGFSDRDFRVFDFYNGYLDAVDAVAKSDHVAPFLEGLPAAVERIRPGSAGLACMIDLRDEKWDSPTCLAYFQREVGDEGERPKNIRILARAVRAVSEARSAACNPVRGSPNERWASRRSVACLRSFSFDAFEEELIQAADELGDYEFDELVRGGGHFGARDYRPKLRALASDVLDRVIEEQQGALLKTALATSGDYLLNSFEYRPRRVRYGLVGGSYGEAFALIRGPSWMTGDQTSGHEWWFNASLRLAARLHAFSAYSYVRDGELRQDRRTDLGGAGHLVFGFHPGLKQAQWLSFELAGGFQGRQMFPWSGPSAPASQVAPELMLSVLALDRIELSARWQLEPPSSWTWGDVEQVRSASNTPWKTGELSFLGGMRW